jgi:hypothetical protein
MDGEMSAQPAALVVSGHMVDTPDRPAPRFPPDQVPRVTRAIRDTLEAWDVGPRTTVLSGGARGADLIVSEEALARGARLRVLLALEPAEFERQSVELPGSDWAERFHRVLDAAEVEVLPPGEGDVFERTNAWLVESARSEAAGQSPHAILVWDGRAGDGPGGTRDLARRLGYAGPDERVAVIDPTRRLYEARQSAPGPKKLLALDGGGIRGVLALEILAALESQLRTRYGDDGLMLSDYFDYVAGTSTGAIIAAAIARGKPVAEIRDKYRALGRRIFRKRFLPLRWRGIYAVQPLTEELEAFFGRNTTLGDPELRSLLLMVLHNSVTDSPWPLSNCTDAKYNRAERNLKPSPDRNLDLALSAVIRGSTAAPLYFAPQTLQVGEHRFVFEDGGVTPFNNPALMLFLMATLPEYRVGWPTGEDNLLLVSVGTGSAAVSHPGLVARSVGVRYQLKNLPGVFMNGASVTQDLICRSLGRTRFGAPIDRELGMRADVAGVGTRTLFSYVRYNADLSAPALAAAGITSAREQRALRKLDAVESIDQLEAVGRRAGANIDLETHFTGFL